MFRNIAGTVVTRLLTAVITLAVVILNTNFLGAEKVGVISLVVLASAIIQIVYGFFGGASLIYFVPRAPLVRLFFPSVIWAFITSAGMAFLLDLLHMVPQGYLLQVICLALVQSLSTIPSMVLLGHERIRAANALTLVQVVLLAAMLLAVYLLADHPAVEHYLYALMVSFGAIFVSGMLLIRKHFRESGKDNGRGILASVLKYGAAAQTGNFIQLLNYRLTYYFVRSFAGLSSLGIFSTGVQVSEGLWIIPRSISLVQFSRISNSDDRKEAVRLTVLFAKISLLITALLMVVLLLIPSRAYVFVFGPEFAGTRLALMSLAVGIVMFSLSVAISPYFSGTGRPLINTIAAALGLVITLTAGFLLIPRLGIVGAGLTSSISYTVTALFQLTFFFVKEKLPLSALAISSDDVKRLRKVLREKLFIKSPDV